MKKSETTKEKIIAAAVILFCRNGYDAATTKAIAEQAGVSEGSVFKYFHSKENLLHHITLQLIEALKAESMEGLMPLISAGHDNIDLYNGLVFLVENRIQFLSVHYYTIQILLQESFINKSIQGLLVHDVWPTMLNLLQPLFEKAIADGEIKKGDSKLYVSMFLSTILTPILTSFLDTSSTSEEREAAVFEQFQFFIDLIKTK